MTMTTDRPKRSRLRVAVLAIAGIEVVLLGALVLLFLGQAGSSDPLSRAIGGAVATVLAVPLAILAVPALALGVIGRWLLPALTLAILVVPATVVIYLFM